LSQFFIKSLKKLRDYDQRFQNAFVKKQVEILAIGIQTDTDHSNEMVTAYYSEPILKKK